MPSRAWTTTFLASSFPGLPAKASRASRSDSSYRRFHRASLAFLSFAPDSFSAFFCLAVARWLRAPGGAGAGFCRALCPRRGGLRLVARLGYVPDRLLRRHGDRPFGFRYDFLFRALFGGHNGCLLFLERRQPFQCPFGVGQIGRAHVSTPVTL